MKDEQIDESIDTVSLMYTPSRYSCSSYASSIASEANLKNVCIKKFFNNESRLNGIHIVKKDDDLLLFLKQLQA